MIIGLTGNMGTGKSTVAKMLEELGALHIDADQLAREVVEPGEPAYLDVLHWFGEQVLDDQGRLDRKALGLIVFRDAKQRKILEKLVHPRITSRIEEIIASQSPETVIVIDAPLLIEAGIDQYVDEIWVTDCPRSTQIARIQKRDRMNEEEIIRRLDAQMSNEQKRASADLVIHTTGTKKELEETVREIWRQRVAGKNVQR